ncbi:hypothetical protein CL614_04510 [archaeon]|nr:hypothetical protein [archaeon]|tara:strand:- start:1355 stop:2758 length:1404 start_codon:yes stop_codon:yes gene_type:complete
METSYSLPCFDQSVLTSKRRFLRTIEHCLDAIRDQKIAQSFGESYSPLTISDINRIIHNLEFQNPMEKIWKSMLLSTMVNCELESGASGIICLITLVELLRNYDKHELSSHQNNSLIQHLKDVSKESSPATYSDYLACIHVLFKDNFTIDLIKNALQLCGGEGQLFIDKTYSRETSIELITGYAYKHFIPDNFLLMTQIKKWVKNDVKIILIDGIIEKVSEIHATLEKLHEDKQPCIIFARGFENDVISTLSTNFCRQTLDVVPVIVPYDLAGINQLKDLAVICGCDVISSLKGELISTLQFDDLVEVQKIIVDENRMIIKQDTTKNIVSLHVNELHKRMLAALSGHDEKSKLLIDRIKMLSSQCVYIKIGDSLKERKGIIIDRLEMAVRSYKDIAMFGILALNDISRSLKFKPNDGQVILGIIKRLEILGFNKIGIKSLHHGILKGVSLAESMRNCKTVVLSDHSA